MQEVVELSFGLKRISSATYITQKLVISFASVLVFTTIVKVSTDRLLVSEEAVRVLNQRESRLPSAAQLYQWTRRKKTINLKGVAGLTIKIVALGDSTTAGTPGFLSPLESPPSGAGDEKSQYSYWLMRGHRDWAVLNRGVNGERSDRILKRFERDVVQEEPAIVIILAGVNDIYQGYSADFTTRNLSKMYSMGLQAGIVPVSCTILPYNTMGGKEKLLRKELNSWIESEARRLEIPFSDTATAVSNPDNRDKLAGSPDGLHPDAAGYRSMAAAIGKTLEGHLT